MNKVGVIRDMARSGWQASLDAPPHVSSNPMAVSPRLAADRILTSDPARRRDPRDRRHGRLPRHPLHSQAPRMHWRHSRIPRPHRLCDQDVWCQHRGRRPECCMPIRVLVSGSPETDHSGMLWPRHFGLLTQRMFAECTCTLTTSSNGASSRRSSRNPAPLGWPSAGQPDQGQRADSQSVLRTQHSWHRFPETARTGL